MTAVLAKIRALSNETRFEILKLVRDREMDAGTVARRFKMSRPAVSQHLSVLREAGLLDERRAGSKRFYVVRPAAFDDLIEFLEGYWGSRLQRLKKTAEAIERSKARK
jgi:DNA-binding transcriptional ArsR family regulator